jgi:hypothetical protein
MGKMIYSTNWQGVKAVVEYGDKIVGYKYADERLKTVNGYPKYLVFGADGYLIIINHTVDLRASVKIPYTYKNLTINMVLDRELHKKPDEIKPVDNIVYLPTEEDKLRYRVIELEVQLEIKNEVDVNDRY